MSALSHTALEAGIDAALAAMRLDEAGELARRYLKLAGPLADLGAAALAQDSWFRSRWLAAQVALTAGNLAEALDHVRPLVPFAGQLPPALACRLWLLVAEAHQRQQHHAEACAALDGLRVPNLAAVCREQATLRLRAVRLGLSLQDVRSLLTEVEACDRLLGDDVANRALLWCETGRAWEVAGNAGEADRCWQQALALCPPSRNEVVRADILIQIGRLAHLRGQLQPALDHYEEALRIAPPQTPQRIEVELRRLLVWLELNQWDRARSRFDQLFADRKPEELPVEVRPVALLVAALLERSKSASGGEELEAYRAWKHGDRQTAFNLYRRALEQTAAPARRARFTLALGQLALANGAAAEARTWLAEAERLAREHALPEVLWRTLEALGTAAAELADDDEAARFYFAEAVAISEEQARQLRHATDRPAYHLHRVGLMRLLLRGACRRGDAAALFHFQELERGRLLCELYREAGRRRQLPDESVQGKELDRRLKECEAQLGGSSLSKEVRTELRSQRAKLQAERGRLLEEFLTDRSRQADAALPGVPELADLQRVLPARVVYVAPGIVEDELSLLVVRRHGARVHPLGAVAARVLDQAQGLREMLNFGSRHRVRVADLDERLDELGNGPLGAALSAILAPGERLVWVPDGELHGLPIAALRRRGRYLIEHVEIVHGFSGALYVHQAAHPARSRRRWAKALVVTEAREVLKEAGREGEGVQAALFRAGRLHGAAATHERIRQAMVGVRVAHFACHAYFDPKEALAAYLQLPSREDWRTLAWLDEPFADLPLVTLSACRSAEVGPLIGREVFGLVTGVLAAGVRAVVAGLWPVADDHAPGFMWRFYRHLLTADLATALARTQREALRGPDASPLDWAVFALFGDTAALSEPGFLGRLWGRWRQVRHARRFPTPVASFAAIEAAW